MDQDKDPSFLSWYECRRKKLKYKHYRYTWSNSPNFSQYSLLNSGYTNVYEYLHTCECVSASPFLSKDLQLNIYVLVCTSICISQYISVRTYLITARLYAQNVIANRHPVTHTFASLLVSSIEPVSVYMGTYSEYVNFHQVHLKRSRCILIYFLLTTKLF